MSVNRAVWKTLFEKDAFPGLPCPQCATGKMKLVPATLFLEEPAFSIQQHGHDDFEPDWIKQRFSARLKCDEAVCGEILTMAGDTETVSVYLEESEGYTGWAVQDVLRPKSVFPAPPLFPILEKAPYRVREQLQLGFQLFWTDLAACAGRLRTAVELMLDDQGVPDQVSKKGKMERATLWDRIESFAATTAGDDLKEPLHALRHIGNLGTHGTTLTSEAFFDAADVLEDVLLGVYEKKSLKKKIKKLTDTKGAY